MEKAAVPGEEITLLARHRCNQSDCKNQTCDPQNQELRVSDLNVVPHLVDDARRVPDGQGEIQEDANPHRNLQKIQI